jgi:hypothetical protein
MAKPPFTRPRHDAGEAPDATEMRVLLRCVKKKPLNAGQPRLWSASSILESRSAIRL